jgi:hypothetical protein
LHPNTSSHFHLKGGIYGLPLLSALYANQDEAARALLGLPPKSAKCDNARMELISRPNFVLKKAKYSKTRHVLTYLCEYGDVNMLQRALTTGFSEASLGDLPMLYEYAASEAVVDVLAAFSVTIFETGSALTHKWASHDILQSGNNVSSRNLKRLIDKYPEFRTEPIVWRKLGDNMLSYAAFRGFDGVSRLLMADSSAFDKERLV